MHVKYRTTLKKSENFKRKKKMQSFFFFQLEEDMHVKYHTKNFSSCTSYLFVPGDSSPILAEQATSHLA